MIGTMDPRGAYSPIRSTGEVGPIAPVSMAGSSRVCSISVQTLQNICTMIDTAITKEMVDISKHLKI